MSFVFTLATLLRVFWQNLRTIAVADNEVRDYLPNLKQGLFEERHILRLAKRRCKSQYYEAAFHTLYGSIKHMIRQFKDLEEPFLARPKARGGRQTRNWQEKERDSIDDSFRQYTSGRSGRREHRASNGRAENGEYEDETEDYYNVQYSAKSFWQRCHWFRRRGSFENIGAKLERIQTRRIARQTMDTYSMIRPVMLSCDWTC